MNFYEIKLNVVIDRNPPQALKHLKSALDEMFFQEQTSQQGKCESVEYWREEKKIVGGGKGAFAWILGVLYYSILLCHKNCHNFENSLKRAYWIEQIKSVLVETPATSTTFPFFNVHLTRLNISKHFLFLALFTFINLNPWFSDMAFYVFNGSYKFVCQPILGARVDLSDW